MSKMKKILLIEDNQDHAFLAKSTITSSGGYQVNLASTGKEALQLFDQEQYDLALLDYALPDINGLTVLSRILEKSENFPVIVITSLGSEVVAVEAMKRGAYDYVVKFGEYYKVLPVVIEKALEKHDLVRSSEEMKRKLEEKATKDLLTGVYNKNHFFELYSRELSIAKRYGRKLALAMIDINNFKAINDTYGHQVGDLVLVQLASILKRSLRSSDVVARYGGDEFIILMFEAGLKEAKATISRIEDSIAQLNLKKELPVEVSASIGVGVGEGQYDTLLEDADKNMYEKKRSYYEGRGKGYQGARL